MAAGLISKVAADKNPTAISVRVSIYPISKHVVLGGTPTKYDYHPN